MTLITQQALVAQTIIVMHIGPFVQNWHISLLVIDSKQPVLTRFCHQPGPQSQVVVGWERCWHWHNSSHIFSGSFETYGPWYSNGNSTWYSCSCPVSFYQLWQSFVMWLMPLHWKHFLTWSHVLCICRATMTSSISLSLTIAQAQAGSWSIDNTSIQDNTRRIRFTMPGNPCTNAQASIRSHIPPLSRTQVSSIQLGMCPWICCTAGAAQCTVHTQ